MLAFKSGVCVAEHSLLVILNKMQAGTGPINMDIHTNFLMCPWNWAVSQLRCYVSACN